MRAGSIDFHKQPMHAERFLQPGVEIANKLSLDASWYEGIDLGDYGLAPEEAAKRALSELPESFHLLSKDNSAESP